jgi:hypothetical protein
MQYWVIKGRTVCENFRSSTALAASAEGIAEIAISMTGRERCFIKMSSSSYRGSGLRTRYV